MSDLECPYCEAELDVCNDDGFGLDEDRRHEMTCHECDRAFVFRTAIHYYYSSFKADCLNGSPHRLKMSNTYPRRYSRMECQDCDYEREPTAEEFATAGITLAEREEG